MCVLVVVFVAVMSSESVTNEEDKNHPPSPSDNKLALAASGEEEEEDPKATNGDHEKNNLIARDQSNVAGTTTDDVIITDDSSCHGSDGRTRSSDVIVIAKEHLGAHDPLHVREMSESDSTSKPRARVSDEKNKTVATTAAAESVSMDQVPSSRRNEHPYQLVFGMDDESSEPSLTSCSPISLEPPPPSSSSPPPNDTVLLQATHDVIAKSLDLLESIPLVGLRPDSRHDEASSANSTAQESCPASELASEQGHESKTAVESDNAMEQMSVYSDSTLVSKSTDVTCSTATAGALHITEGGDEKQELKGGTAEEKRDAGETEAAANKPPKENGIPPSGGGSARETVESPLSLTDVKLAAVTDSDSLDSPPPKSKSETQFHPLSLLVGSDAACDSDVPPTPPYSPLEYRPEDSGGEEGGDEGLDGGEGEGLLAIGDQPSMSVLFAGITYLGSSTVDAPISEKEANRKMYTLKYQAMEPMPVILSIPTSNDGSIHLRDPTSDQPLAIFPVKQILFCARGKTDGMEDSFCFNVRHKRSGIYHCHVFQCEILEAVSAWRLMTHLCV